MKKVMIAASCLVVCVGIGLALSSSTCDKKSFERQKNESVLLKKNFIVQPDSTVVNLLGKDCCNALFSAKKATLYKMNPAVRPTDQDQTIGGVKVENKMECLQKHEIYLFQFLLADSMSFSDMPLVPTTPFAPTAAIEFSGKGGTVSLLFSMTSQEIGIVENGQIVKVERYTNARIITRFFALKLDEQFYYNILKQLS